MCIGFWSLIHPDYSLVLCTNRDEYLSRPTDPAHWHSFESSAQNEQENAEFVLSGVDTSAGGTWFGINKHGDVSLLTNITEPSTKAPSSRGHLCSSFLLRNRSTSQTSTLPQFVEQLTASETRYAGFNMVVFTPQHNRHSVTDSAEEYTVEYDAAMLSNCGAGNRIRSIPIVERAGGCGSISNDSMNGIDPFTYLKSDAEWPKAMQGRKSLSKILSQTGSETEDSLIERLFDMLRTKTHSPPTTRQAFQETIMVDVLDMPSLRSGPSFSHTGAIGDILQEGVTSDGAAVRSHMTSPTNKASLSKNVLVQATSKYYATRLSSVLLIRKDGRALFVERDVWIIDKDDRPTLVKQEQCQGRHERRYSFQII